MTYPYRNSRGERIELRFDGPPPRFVWRFGEAFLPSSVSDALAATAEQGTRSIHPDYFMRWPR